LIDMTIVFSGRLLVAEHHLRDYTGFLYGRRNVH
jgi:hypothetical protein